MDKYVVKVRVRQADGAHANVSLPVTAGSEEAAKTLIKADLDRQVAAGTLVSYGSLAVRKV